MKEPLKLGPGMRTIDLQPKHLPNHLQRDDMSPIGMSVEERDAIARAHAEGGWCMATALPVIMAIETQLIFQELRCHVGLTGGVLYKAGWRKDLDLIIYQEGSSLPYDRGEVLDMLRTLNFDPYRATERGRVVKAWYGPGNKYPVDLFFIEDDVPRSGTADKERY